MGMCMDMGVCTSMDVCVCVCVCVCMCMCMSAGASVGANVDASVDASTGCARAWTWVMCAMLSCLQVRRSRKCARGRRERLDGDALRRTRGG